MSTILKCKMCGGDIEVGKDMTVGTCLYCGSVVTLPRIDTDKKARMFNRANQYRMESEFDKAYRVYEAILEEDAEEAEAYWGLILSEYGVEYVVDPVTQKRVPTCHRTQTKLIKSSSNYENAIKYADSESRFIYEDEATKIDNIQKKILTISYKEEPYDVFICYKESDVNGERTEDSVLAQSIYDELEQKGIKTFFARISLEDKLGKDYEPYIFSALNSAKVMLVVTTCNEHCEAVWVRNEWSRYLRFMEDGNKTLIPVFKTMSPYELPDELSKFQAQDMGKVGAIQDLVRGVQKLLGQTKTEKDNAALNELLAEKREREEQAKVEKKKRKIFRAIVLVVVVCGLIAAAIYKFMFVPAQIYNKALEAQNIGEYQIALSYLDELNDNYKDVLDLKNEAIYNLALEEADNQQIDKALERFEMIKDYKDSKEYLYRLWGKKAWKSMNNGDKIEALKDLKKMIEYCVDNEQLKKNSLVQQVYLYANNNYNYQNYGLAEDAFEILSRIDFKDSAQCLEEIRAIEGSSEEEYKNIWGVYKNCENGLYIAFKENNKLYISRNENEINNNTVFKDWSYAYIADKAYFKLLSNNDKIFEVYLKNNELQINEKQTNYNRTEYEKMLVGTYEKIE